MLRISFHTQPRLFFALVLALVALCIPCSRLQAQTEAAVPHKWELGLRINRVTIAGEEFSTEDIRSEGLNASVFNDLMAVYRPSDKLFWRFGLGVGGSRWHQSVYDVATNRLATERSRQTISLTSLLSIGHTFAPPKHPRLQRFRLSTGLNFRHSNTLSSDTKRLSYVVDQDGNVTTIEGEDFEAFSVHLGIEAFGLVEMRLGQRLHLGAEFTYGINASRVVYRTAGSPADPPAKTIYTQFYTVNRLISPSLTLTYRF